MKCPRCGCELVEGHLYCDVCGMEIQMVPDFEPEIENSITEALSTVAEETRNFVKQAVSGSKKIKKKEGNPAGRQSREHRLLLRLISFTAIAVSAVYVAVLMYHRYSAGYQIEQARLRAEEGNYQEAIEYLERAGDLRNGGVDLIILESDYYYQMGEKQKAVDVLLNFTGKESVPYEDKEQIYGRIISIYDEEGRYEEINALLSSCGDDEITHHFQQYMAMTPEFGFASGNYDEMITLQISANTAGTIYYTLDGSEPDEKSHIYTAPLFLESGEYQVAAVFVNDYGIKSETARSWYVIHLTVPNAPEISLTSGDYHTPTMIEVTPVEGGTVYYTVDGSVPGIDSNRYTQPISMPLGRSNFKFVTISEEGVSSEVVSRSYHLELDTEVTPARAVSNVMDALFRRNVLTDLQGHSFGIVGKYVFKYNSIVEVPNLGYYYVLDEYVEDENGNQTKTDHLYAVEIYTGAPNRLTYDENGQMGLISLQ